GWTADAALSYVLPVAGGWSVRPGVGRRGTAVFVDGGATFACEAGTVRPYLTLGARYQVQGRTPYAVAGFSGGLGPLAAGATRAPVLATATLGADAALTQRLSLFGALTGESGDADHRAAGRVGVRLGF
ncbi:autotransporter domain-containing protein, partial [Sphingomonas bacterium]|uniref:autotransporter domain-containing protein n=1 Tax=Sphingomonas bacterium TaxID=1895847 RepID=UPI0015772B7E